MFEIGKSGYLLDISNSFGFWRTYAVNCLNQRDVNGAATGLYTLNGCFTEDYAVKISTKEYDKKIKLETTCQCKHCTMSIEKIFNEGEEDEYTRDIVVPTEIDFSQVRIFELRTREIEQVLTGIKKRKVWECPNCKELNILSETTFFEPTRERPFYIRIVPDPPIKPGGIEWRNGFYRKFEEWFYNFLEEIQASMVEYRVDYIKQNEHDMMDSGYVDKGDLKIASN